MHLACKRAVAVFLLTLALAVPLAALPAAGPPPDRTVSLFGAVWEGLVSIFGALLADPSPEGGTVDSGSAQNPIGGETDSRSSMDPDGHR